MCRINQNAKEDLPRAVIWFVGAEVGEELENEWWGNQWGNQWDIDEQLAPLEPLGEIEISEEFLGLIDNYFEPEGEDWDSECVYGWTGELYRGWTYTG